MKTSKLGKILVVALFVMLFALVLTVSVNAANTDVTTADGLTTALGSAKSGDTITVTATIPITADTTINVPEGVTVKGSVNPLFKVTGADVTLTVTGEGAINGTANLIEAAANGVKVLLNGGTLTTTGNDNSGAIVYDASVANATTVEINGAALTTNVGWAVDFNKNDTAGTGKKVVKMTAGSINAEHVVVFNNNGADVPVDIQLTGGSITSANTIVYLRVKNSANKASVQVAGTTLKTTGNDVVFSIGTATKAEVTVSAGTVTAGGNLFSVSGSSNVTANLFGGTLSATNYAFNVAGTSNVTVNMTGGELSTTKVHNNEGLIYVGSANATFSATVSGGKISAPKVALLGTASKTANNAQVTLTNVTVTCYDVINTNSGGNGTVTIGEGADVTSALAIFSTGGAYTQIAVNVTGGSLKAPNLCSNGGVVEYWMAGATLLNITDGTVTVENATTVNQLRTTLTGGALTIGGETFAPATATVENTNTGVKYDSLKAAVDAATAGDTLTILANITVDADITIGKKLTIDAVDGVAVLFNNRSRIVLANGADITFTDAKATFMNFGVLADFVDAGTAAMHFQGGVYSSTHDLFTITDLSALALTFEDGCEFHQTGTGHIVNKYEYNSTEGKRAGWSTTTLVFNGGYFASSGTYMFYSRNAEDPGLYLDITINGGEFVCTKTSGEAMMFGTTDYQGKVHVAVHGGTFRSEYADAISTAFRNNGLELKVTIDETKGDVLFDGITNLVWSNRHGTTFTVSGGTFNVTRAIYAYGSNNQDNSTITATITGGTFNCSADFLYVSDYTGKINTAKYEAAATVTIDGKDVSITTAAAGFSVCNGGTLTATLKNGKMTVANQLLYTNKTDTTCTLNVQGGEVYCERNDTNGGLCWIANTTNTTNINISGGKITSLKTPLVGIDGSNAVHAKTTISGGEINTNSLINENSGKGKHDVTVSGGKIVLVGNVFYDDGGAAKEGYMNITLTGGEITAKSVFSNSPSTCLPQTLTIAGGKYNGATYIKSTDADNNLVKMGDSYYKNLQAALEVADDTNGAVTIELIGTQVLKDADGPIIINKNVIITSAHEGDESLMFYHEHANGTVVKLNGTYDTFRIEGGKSVTFAGNVTYIHCGINVLGDANATVTFAGNVKFDSGDDGYIVVASGCTAAALTVNVQDKAHLRGAHVIISNSKTTAINVSMTGGVIETVASSALYVGGSTLTVDMSAGTIKGLSNAFKVVDGTANITVTGGSFDLTYNVFEMSGTSATLKVSNAEIVDCNNLLYAVGAGTHTLELTNTAASVRGYIAHREANVDGSHQTTVTINSGKITCSGAKLFWLTNIKANHTDLTVNVKGGEVISTFAGTSDNSGARFAESRDGNGRLYVNVSGGTVKWENATAASDVTSFVLSRGGDVWVNLTGGTITGFDYVINAARNTTYVTVGAVDAEGKLTSAPTLTAKKAVFAAYAYNYDGNTATLDLTVHGGTFQLSNMLVWVSNGTKIGTTTALTASAKVTINGGTFTTSGHLFHAVSGTMNLTVNGGTFAKAARVVLVENASGTVEIKNATVTTCQSLFYANYAGTCTVTVDNVTVGAVSDTALALRGGTYSNVTVKGLNITGKVNGHFFYTDTNSKVTAATFENCTANTGSHAFKFNGASDDVTLTIKSGTFTAAGTVFEAVSGKLNLTVDNGTFTSTGNRGVYVQKGTATITFNNATFNTKNEVVKSETTSTSLTLTVKKGTYVSTNERVFYLNSATNTATVGTKGMNNADLTVKTNAALQLFADHKGSNSTFNVTVNGGTFTATGASGLFDINKGVTGSITVNGGEFEAITSGHIFDLSDDAGLKQIDVTVNGGTFKTASYFIRSCNNTGTITMTGGTVTCAHAFVVQGVKPTSTKFTDKVLVEKYGTLDANGVLKYETEEFTPDVKIVISGGTVTATNTVHYVEKGTNVYTVISGSPVLSTTGKDNNMFYFAVPGMSAGKYWTRIDISGTPTINHAGKIMFNSTSIDPYSSFYDINISGGTFNFTSTQTGNHYFFHDGDWQGKMSVNVSGGTFGWNNPDATKACNIIGFVNAAEHLTVELSGGTFKDIDILVKGDRKDNGSKTNVAISGTFKVTNKLVDTNTGMFYTAQVKDTINISVSGGEFNSTQGPVFGNIGKMNATISGGVINSPYLINMNGGSVNASVTITGTADVNLTGNLFIDAPNDNNSQTDVILSGGTLTADRLFGGNMNGTASLTMTGGKYNGAAYVENEAGVVRVGDTYYPSLKVALENVTGDTPEAPVTVTLVGGITVSETLVINKNVIITGGTDTEALLVYGAVTDRTPTGGTLKTFEIAPGKSVTFSGNVTYISCGFYLADSAATDVTTVTFAGKVYVNNYEVDTTGHGSYAFESRNTEAAGKLIVNVEDSARLRARHCIILNGADMTYEVNIKGGTLTSTQSTAVYVADVASLTVKMTGGTIDGVSNAFQILNTTSTLEVTDATFNIDAAVFHLRQGNHSLTAKNVTVTKAHDLVKLENGGNLGTAAKPATLENITATLTGTFAYFNNGAHFLTVKNTTVSAASNGVYLTNGASLGSAAAPAVLENVTATVINHMYYTDWTASASFIHFKSGTYSNTAKNVLFLSRSGNENIIIGTAGAGNDAVKLTTSMGSQLFGAHCELHNGKAVENRGIYNLTIYNGTFSVTSNNLIDLNRGLSGSITIHNGVFTANTSGNIMDIWGEYDLDKDGNTIIVNGTPWVDPNTNAPVGYNAVDVTVLGGTFTANGVFINASCYTGVITVENANIVKCSKIVQVAGGDSDYTQADGKKIAYVAGSGGAPVINDSINAWLTANGLTSIKVKDDLSGTPHVVIVINNVTATTTNEAFRMQGSGNVLMNVSGDNTDISSTGVLIYRDMFVDPSKSWQVINISGGKMTTSHQRGFYFPGNQNAKDNLFITFNISGGEFKMTKPEETDWRGVVMFDPYKAATQLFVNITGGTFKYEASAASETPAMSTFYLNESHKSIINMTGGTIEGFDNAFWGSRRGLNVTIGAQNATTFPTINVKNAIFYSVAHNWEGDVAELTATVWGGNYTVKDGYIFYVSTGLKQDGKTAELYPTVYFTIHSGTYTAKGLVYEQGGDKNYANVGSASNPVVIKSGTFTMTENLFYNRIGGMYVTIENGDFNVGDAIFRTWGGWNSYPEGDANRKWRSPSLGLTVKNGDFDGKHFIYHDNGTLGTDAAPCVIENATINTTDTAFRFHDNNIRFRIDNATVTSGKTLFYCGTVVDTMSLTVNGGTYKCLKPAGATDGNGSYRMFYLNGETGSNKWMTLTVNGGSFESTGEFIKAEDVVVKCTINIKAGTIVAHSERGIYSSLNNSELHLNLGDPNAVNDNSKLSITTEASAQVIALHGSGHTLDVNVYGGTFEAKAASFIDINNGNSGTINIQGGKITTATSGIDFDGENKENTATVGDNVTVTTNFTKNADGSFTPVTKSEKANLVLNITGGTFRTGGHFIVSGNAYNAQVNISGPVSVTALHTQSKKDPSDPDFSMIYHQNGSNTLTGKWLQVNISATEAGTPTFLNYSDRMFGQAGVGGNVVDSAYFDIRISGGVFKMARPTGTICFFMPWDGNGAMSVDISGGTFKWENPDPAVTESMTYLCVFRNQANLLNANVSGGTFENVDLFAYNSRGNETKYGKVVSTTNVAVSGTAKVIGTASTKTWGLFLTNAGGDVCPSIINAYISGGELSANNEPMMFATNKHIINATIVGGKLTATAGDTNRGMFSKDGAAGEITVNIGGTAEVTYAEGPIFGYFGTVNSTISGGKISGKWLSNANNNSYIQNINIKGGTLNFTASLFTQGGAPTDPDVNRVTVTIGGGNITTPKLMDTYWSGSAIYFVFVEKSTFTYNGVQITPDGSGVRDGNVENGTLYPTLQMAYENVVAVEGVKTLVIVNTIAVQSPVVFTDTVVLTGEVGAFVIGSYDYVDTGILQAANGAHLTLTGDVKYVNCVIEGLAGSEVTFAGNVKLEVVGGAVYVNKGAGNATVNLTENAHIKAAFGIFFYDRAAQGLATDVKTINVSGGTIEATSSSIDIRSTNATVNIGISGGQLVSTSRVIYISAANVIASIDMSGGQLVSNYRAIDIGSANATASINISGGMIDAAPGNGFAINLSGSALQTTLNMTGGYLKGNHCIYMNPTDGVTTLNISGGTIETIQSSAIYQTNNKATATVNLSGTASIFGPASCVKGTGGSTMNVNITGGTYQAKWRVVEHDNANGAITIKNATVTECASLFYAINAGTRTVNIENVTIESVTDTVLAMRTGTYTATVKGLTVTGRVVAHFFFTDGNAKVTATFEDCNVTTDSRTFKINGASDDVTLTIKSGNYTVNNTANDDYVIGLTDTATLKFTANIEGGTFRNTGNGGYFFGASNGTTELNISGGDINVSNYVFAYWGAVKATVNISGGTLSGKRIVSTSGNTGLTLGHENVKVIENGVEVERDFNYKVFVTGGVLTSTDRTFSMVDNSYAYVHISGGDITATTGHVFYRSDHTDKNGATDDRAGKGYSYVLITDGNINANTSSVFEINDAYAYMRIEGGDFAHASWLFHVTKDTNNNGMAYATVDITGGSFASMNSKGGGICSDNYNELTISVTGGTFNYGWEMIKINGSADVDVYMGGTANVSANRVFWANTGATATTNLTVDGGTYVGKNFFVQQGASGAELTEATTNVTVKGNPVISVTATSGDAFYARGGKMNIEVQSGDIYAPVSVFAADSSDMKVDLKDGIMRGATLLRPLNRGFVYLTTAEAVTLNVQQIAVDYAYYDTADQVRVYAGFAGAVETAPAGATVYVVGNPVVSETASRKGDLTISGNGTVTGTVVFINIVGATTLTFDGDVTYSGTVSIVQIPATDTPFESTVNFTKGTFRVSGGSTNGAVFVDREGDSVTTVNVYDGADIRVGGWGIAFNTDRSSDSNGVKNVNIYGGYLSGSHGPTFVMSGVEANVTVSGGTLESTSENFYFSNRYFKTNAQENFYNLTITGGTFIAKANNIFLTDNSNGTINISGGTFKSTDIIEVNHSNDLTNSSLKMPVNGEEETFHTVIIVTGGTFEATEKGINKYGNSKVYASFTDATVVAGKQLIAASDDTFGGKSYAYFEINGGSYTGIGDVIFWLRDSQMDVVVNAGPDGSEPVLVSNKHFTYSYQNTGSTFAPVMDLTINAGQIECNGYLFAFMNNSIGTVNINGGTLTSVFLDSGRNNAAAGAMDAGGTVTFNVTGGVINCPDIPAFGKGGTCTVNISGGEVNTCYLMNANGTVANETVNISGDAVINCTYAVLTDGTAGSKQFLNISGGTINAPLLATGAFAIDVEITVTGGTINVRDHSFDGAATDVVKNQTTGALYNDLQSAIDAAVDGDVLEILGDFVIDRSVEIAGKTLTITGGTLETPVTVLGAVDSLAKHGTAAYATFILGNGANVTFTGHVSFLESALVLEGDDIVLTLTGDVKFDSGRRSHIVYNKNSDADGDVTVYLAGNATLVGNYAVYFTGDKSMTSTNANKSVYMSGGLIDANHGLLFQYVNGVNGLFNLTGGKIDVASSAIWLDSHNVDGKRITVILNGVTIESDDVAVTASKNADLLTDITVYAGTTIHAGLDNVASDSGDYAITLETNAHANPSTLVIYGGTFITETGHAAIQVTSRSAVFENPSEATGSKAYIYGGYFVGKTLGTLRASSGGYLYVYGGYVVYDSTDGNGGSPVRSGTGSTSAETATIGNAFIYGGNYVTGSVGAAFATANELANIELHIAGTNANGGAYLVNKTGSMQYYKDGERHLDGAIAMTDGAGVRIATGSNGLRFVSIVTAETLVYLESIGATNVKFGTLIAPTDLVEQARSFTAADMKAAGLKYLDIPAKDGLVERAAGGYYIRAAIVNIQEGNIGREFAAVGYITYTIVGVQGEPVEITIYTSYRENKNARSIEQVARLALKDAELYTAAQLEILREYAPDTEAPVIDFYLVAGQSNAAGSSAFTEAMKEINPSYKDGYEYILYSGSSNRAVRLGVPTKLGFGSGDHSFGPELGMADAMSQFYNEETGRYAAIIKYAYGGTRLYDNLSGSDAAEGSWCPPSWLAVNKPLDEVRSGGLFRAFVNHIESCVADYEAMGFDVNIQSVYWMQGESDINAHAKDGLYDDIFKVWISDLRNSVCNIMDDDSYQSLPIIVGEISEYFGSNSGEEYHRKNLEFVKMQREIIGSWENVYVIPQGNVPTVDYDNDNAHWGFHEHVWNGYMVGSKMLELAHGFYTSVSEEDAVAEVWLDGQLLGTYNNLGGAISMAPEGAVVKLLKDIRMYSTLAIGNRNKITLDGCDHKIDYTPIQHTVGSFSAIKCYNTDITIMNLHVINHTYTEFNAEGAEIKLATYGVVLHFNAKVTWMGGSLEVERHGFVLNNSGCELTIVSGDFKLRDTAITYAAVVFNGAGNVKVTIEGGNFDCGVGTAYAIYLEGDANGSKIVLNGGTFDPGDKSGVVVKNHCTDATIIVSDNAVLNGTVENAGKSE